MTSATCCCSSPLPLIPLLQSSPFPVVGPVVSMSASLSSLVANITSLFSRSAQQALLLFEVEKVPTGMVEALRYKLLTLLTLLTLPTQTYKSLF